MQVIAKDCQGLLRIANRCTIHQTDDGFRDNIGGVNTLGDTKLSTEEKKEEISCLWFVVIVYIVYIVYIVFYS